MFKILHNIEMLDVPVIHFGTGTSTLLEAMAKTGGTVLGLDWRIPLDQGWRRIGWNRSVQGNLDPTTLFAPRHIIQQRASAILQAAANRNGHIFNLGHGILPETPETEVQALVDFVHQSSQR